MMDTAKSEMFRNFTFLNKALLFSVKLNKAAVQSELNQIVLIIFIEFIYRL